MQIFFVGIILFRSASLSNHCIYRRIIEIYGPASAFWKSINSIGTVIAIREIKVTRKEKSHKG